MCVEGESSLKQSATPVGLRPPRATPKRHEQKTRNVKRVFGFSYVVIVKVHKISTVSKRTYQDHVAKDISQTKAKNNRHCVVIFKQKHICDYRELSIICCHSTARRCLCQIKRNKRKRNQRNSFSTSKGKSRSCISII